MPGEGEKGDMNPFYREAMNAHLGDDAPEEEQTIWKEVFVEDFERLIAKAKNQQEAEDITFRWAVSEIKKLPDGEERIQKLLEEQG